VTGITVTPTAGLTTTEAAAPRRTRSSDIAAHGRRDDRGELDRHDRGHGQPVEPDVHAANWNIPQTVTVTGVNDAVDDGDILTTSPTRRRPAPTPPTTGSIPSTSPSSTPTATPPASSSHRLRADHDRSRRHDHLCGEAPDTADRRRHDRPELGQYRRRHGEPSSLTFTTVNWNTPQIVTVTGVNDAWTMATSPTTSSPRRREQRRQLRRVRRERRAGDQHRRRHAGITVTPTAGLTTTEAGGTATFTVVLNSQPTANVVIGPDSSNTAEGTVGPSLTFTSANWNTAQTVTGDRRQRRRGRRRTSPTRS
jgi:hypothetical protein